VAWKGDASHVNPSFCISGLLFNSDLLLYDRQSEPVWSQMYEISGNGEPAGEVPERIQFAEARFSTLRSIYPDVEARGKTETTMATLTLITKTLRDSCSRWAISTKTCTPGLELSAYDLLGDWTVRGATSIS
jgi:hypothetical protein